MRTNLHKINKQMKLSEDDFTKVFEEVKNSIEHGVANANAEFKKNPEQFDFRGARAIYTTSAIKKLFRRSIYTNESMYKMIKHLLSHGVDYFLVKGKFLLCIKKMDKKGRVSSFYSKRFQETINGGKVKYSNKMLNFLSQLGILKPLPIYFAGYVLDQAGRLDNILLVNYEQGEIENVISLKQLFEPNLFNIAADINTANNVEELVKAKKKEALKKVSDN